ncbi:hypothetical protein [Sphingomonas sp. ID0503]|uniref:hypothetical protein n=1 Tax=Sphingomonas sp. ID0503 TaxID=3399691 RepID=UPI003AFAA911
MVDAEAIALANEHARLRVRQEITATGRPLRVAFLVNDRTKWNGDTLLAELRRHSDIDARLFVTLTHRDKTPAARNTNYAEELAFFRKIDPLAVALYDPVKKKRAFHKRDLDVVFYQQPWGMKAVPSHMLGRSLGVSMHYGYAIYSDFDAEYTIPTFHPYIWRFLAQNDVHRAVHLRHDPEAADRILVTGYPKLDAYYGRPPSAEAWPHPERAGPRVIYAPHHALKNEMLRIATFDWNYDLMYRLAAGSGEVDWIYKPHGRLKYTVPANGVMSLAEYEAYEASWNALGNARVYRDGDYFDIFRTSTALITEGASFLGEYMPTEMPIIWLKAEHPAVTFNAVGADFAQTFYPVHDRAELAATFEAVVLRGEDPKKDLRREVAARHFGRKSPVAPSIVDMLRRELIPPAS